MSLPSRSSRPTSSPRDGSQPFAPVRRLAPAVLVALGLLLPHPSTARPQCLADGDAVTGTLRIVKTRHPNGTPITAYQVVTAQPVCVLDLDDKPQDSSKFHVVPRGKADEAALKRAVGRSVTVRGNPMAAHTAWHIGDAVIMEAVVADR